MNLILSGVNLFFCFVYLEIIELNFWGINQNLKVNIGKRVIDEENTLIDEKQEWINFWRNNQIIKINIK